MREDDRPRFVTALTWLAGKYPVGKDKVGRPIPYPLTDIDLKEYFEALADLPIGAIETGCRYHYGHSEFFPSRPASLRKSVEAVPPPPPMAFVPSWRRSGQAALPEKVTSPEEAKTRLSGIFRKINEKFGTTLRVK